VYKVFTLNLGGRIKMKNFWYEAFITKSQEYVLLDGDGDIRASAPDLNGILLAKKKIGFGDVHKIVFDGKTLKIIDI